MTPRRGHAMPPRSRALRAAGAYAAVGAASLVAAFLLLQLWRAVLRVPFGYDGDTLPTGMVVKTIVERGWYLNNPRLGGPTGLHLHDFPIADVAHLLAF